MTAVGIDLTGMPRAVRACLTADARLSRRFWSKVAGGDVGECWIWNAYRQPTGYGRFNAGGRRGSMIEAHRAAWLMLRGEIPHGLQLDHLCRVRPCVNPWHLDPVTPKVNSQRSDAGRINGARQRAITHCPSGHAYDDTNTYTDPKGARRCRACGRNYMRARRAAKGGVAA